MWVAKDEVYVTGASFFAKQGWNVTVYFGIQYTVILALTGICIQNVINVTYYNYIYWQWQPTVFEYHDYTITDMLSNLFVANVLD